MSNSIRSKAADAIRKWSERILRSALDRDFGADELTATWLAAMIVRSVAYHAENEKPARPDAMPFSITLDRR